jgi:hypothetical protein
MADVSTLFTSESPYLKAADHPGFNRQCTIKGSGTDTLNFPGKDPQPGAWINIGGSKPIWLSKTNGRALIGAFGKETSDWIGKKVLVTTKDYTLEGGKQTTGWLIIPMTQDDGFDDEIPF